MSPFVGLTGTPGTGKKTLAPSVAAELGVPSFGLNDLAEEYCLAANAEDEASVDTALLGQMILRKLTGPALLYGHLLPYTLGAGSVSRVVVLRCEPSVLKKRLLSRGYRPKKLHENLEAELIGVLSSASDRSFGRRKVSEFDTTRADPKKAGKSVARLISGRAKGERLEWTRGYDSASRLRSLLSLRR